MKTLDNLIRKGKKGLVIAGLVGVLSLGNINSARAEDKPYGPTDFGKEFIEEATPLGIPIKILRSIFGSETKVYVNPPRETSYRNKKELPLIFTCTGGVNPGEEYEGVGTKIFFSGQKEYYIVGKKEIFNRGTEVINYTVCLTTGEKFLPVKKGNKKVNIVCKFNADAERKYGRKHGYSVTLWKNIWCDNVRMVNGDMYGRERGSVVYAIVDTEMMEQQRLKSENKNQSQ